MIENEDGYRVMINLCMSFPCRRRGTKTEREQSVDHLLNEMMVYDAEQPE